MTGGRGYSHSSNGNNHSSGSHYGFRGSNANYRGQRDGRFGHGRGIVPLCTFCNNTGHTVDNCYRKHGFPIGYTDSKANAVELQT